METPEIDLFDKYELLPKKIQKILEDFGECATYDQCDKLLALLNPLGYTFEYGLDATPYGLQKI